MGNDRVPLRLGTLGFSRFPGYALGHNARKGRQRLTSNCGDGGTRKAKALSCFWGEGLFRRLIVPVDYKLS